MINKQTRVYLASPFFNDEEIERVAHVEQVLRMKGMYVFSPRENQLEGVEYMSQPWRDAVFANDVTNIHKADLVVAVYDGKDEGTMWELGYAYANRIPFVVFNEKDGDLNLMVTESMQAILHTREQLMAYDFNKLERRTYNGSMR
jgi:nucleoside 2-deoxyribosyltransferase